MRYHVWLLVSICLIEAFFSVFSAPKRQRFLKVFFMGLMLFLFAALRDETVGTDILGYCIDFEKDGRWTLSQILNAGPNYTQSRDPVFHVFLHFLARISKDPQIMLVAVGLLVAIGFSVFVYYQKGSVLVYYILFVTLRIFPFTLSGLRQAMAMAFVFMAFAALQNRKHFLFLLLTAMGGLFHESAFVFLLALPLVKFKSTIVVGVSAIIIAFVNTITRNRLVAWLAANLLGGRFSNYASTAIDGNFEGSATYLLYLLLFVTVMLFYPVFKQSYKDTGAMFRLSSVTMMFAVVGQSMPNMFRITYYFIFALLGFFPRLIERMFEPRIRIVVIALFAFVMGAQYILLGPSAGVDNYLFFWQQ